MNGPRDAFTTDLPQTVVVTPTPEWYAQAHALATQWGLPLDTAFSKAPYRLMPTPDGLQLHSPAGPVQVDFHSPEWQYRRRTLNRQQPLARAIGIKGLHPPDVLDATAGFGSDAFMLACLGCTVRLIERAIPVAVLLQDGLMRAAANPDLQAIAQRLSLQVTDSRRWLQCVRVEEWPTVIYLDPMYPTRRKSALVNKKMQALHALLGTDDTGDELLAIALQRATQRVVVKRPHWAPPLAGHTPDWTIQAPQIRFDVYRSDVSRSRPIAIC